MQILKLYYRKVHECRLSNIVRILRLKSASLELENSTDQKWMQNSLNIVSI